MLSRSSASIIHFTTITTYNKPWFLPMTQDRFAKKANVCFSPAGSTGRRNTLVIL